MGLGFLNLNYISCVLSYDDETTPVKLTGKKMLPIFEFNEFNIKNESLEIIKELDSDKKINFNHYDQLRSEVDHLLEQIGKNVHSLCMPYWIWTPEFNDHSRAYFQQKKEAKRGPFKNLIKNKSQFLNPLNSLLMELEKSLKPFYKSEQMTIVDIMLASHLWGMYLFPEFQFSPKIHQYLQSIKNQCHFDYHQDYFL
jgi:glutaredoxin 2